MEFNSEEVKKAVAAMRSFGIGIMADDHICGSSVFLNADDVIALMTSKDDFFCMRNGISKEEYADYLSRKDNLSTCLAATQKGLRCQSDPHPYIWGIVDSVKAINRAKETGDWSDYYCHAHKASPKTKIWDESDPDCITVLEVKNKKTKSGFIYLVKEKQEGNVKIGRSVNLNDRVRTFEVKMPFPIEEEYSFECFDYVRSERLLHKHFSDKRVRGEWFSLSDSDIEMIKNHSFLDGLGIEVIS